MNRKYIDETIGWTGSAVLILAYALTSYGVLEGKSMSYQLLNLIGSLCLMYYTYIKKAYPNTVLNIIWAVIGITAIVKLLYF